MDKVFYNKGTKRIHSNKRGDACRVQVLKKKNLEWFTGETELEAILNAEATHPKAKRCGHCLKGVEVE